MSGEAPPINALSMSAAAKLVQVDGKAVSPVTVWRWARYGRLDIRLKTWKRGRGLVTTRDALVEFEAAVAEADAARWAKRDDDPLPAPTQIDVEARAKELDI